MHGTRGAGGAVVCVERAEPGRAERKSRAPRARESAARGEDFDFERVDDGVAVRGEDFDLERADTGVGDASRSSGPLEALTPAESSAELRGAERRVAERPPDELRGAEGSAVVGLPGVTLADRPAPLPNRLALSRVDGRATICGGTSDTK